MNPDRPAGPLRQMGRRIGDACSYACMRAGRTFAAGAAPEAATGDASNAALLTGWPRNHVYSVQKGRLVPVFALWNRWREVRRHCGTGPESLLDIGCCRGYYVLDAALRPGCRRAVGVDVAEPFIRAADFAKQRLGLDDARAQFHVASLEDVAARPSFYGAPFETVLFLGTYHYVYWGSERDAGGVENHATILKRLASVCSGHVLFSGRLEVEHLPPRVRERVERSPGRQAYCTRFFKEEAGRWFDVRTVGRLGKYPLMDLKKLGSGCAS